MTESEWLSCQDPQKMLEWLHHSRNASDRKLRLFACACCRRVWHLLKDRRAGKAIEFAEQYADGHATTKQLHDSDWGRANEGTSVVLWNAWEAGRTSAEYAAARLSSARAASDEKNDRLWESAFQVAWQRGDSPSEANRAADAVVAPAWLEMRETARAEEQMCQCHLLRDIFGPLPFREVHIDPAWFSWNDGTVKKLAEAAYEHRLLPEGTLDQARLAVLADALEEAGCTDKDIRGHLRGPGLHVRGCHVIDLLLSRE